jgi:hypothetical protein
LVNGRHWEKVKDHFKIGQDEFIDEEPEPEEEKPIEIIRKVKKLSKVNTCCLDFNDD